MTHPGAIVLGLDPGVARLGWGVVEAAGSRRIHIDHGCLTTIPTLPHPDRLLALFRGVRKLLDLYRPDLVAVEQVFFRKNVKTAMAVAEARGLVLAAAAEAGCPVAALTPSEVKQGIVGWGRAEKHQVQEMVRLLLGLAHPPSPDDAADALAIAFVASNGRQPERWARIV